MIERVIKWSLDNRFLVMLFTVMVVGAGALALKTTPVDAIPDLSDVQVIIKTSYPGQAPQVVEDQVTYPLTTAMLSVPKAAIVRGYSFFGDSYVYIIFDEGTDLYWARSRVLEYLSQVAGDLPSNAKPQLGPDATGVGWIYEYALVDRTGKHDLSQLRAIQDWFLKYELQTVHGVSEVSTIGGMVRQYQVVVDPDALRAYNIPLSHIKRAIQRGNKEVGGAVIEMGEAEYMVRATGYIQSMADIEKIPLKVDANGTPITVRDVATVRMGPQMRRGMVDLNGEGEVVGGVVIMRFGENALTTIEGVKQRLEKLKAGLPEGVEIVPTYDRSTLIESAVETLRDKLVEEFIGVILVCLIFLFHLRSAGVLLVSLPIGILMAFGIMRVQGLNANIMSLGGIALAIGAMVGATVIMIEKMHKHMEAPDYDDSQRWLAVRKAAVEVGPALFFSLLIITVSFMPVLSLEAQEGRLFSPLAWTKTWSMASAALLSVTLVPVLMGYFIRGHIIPEHKNPVNRSLKRVYRPVLKLAVSHPWSIVLGGLLLTAVGLWPATKIGSEFMPDLNEGDLLYMPTTFPAISTGKAQQLAQQTDKLIMTIPEVKSAFGKIGRAETATDPAPLTMMETVIQLKPKDQWRPGITVEDLKRELNQRVNLPGVTNAWVMPIKTRIDMLATGIKTPVGIKVAGPDLKVIQRIGKAIEKVLKPVRGTASVFAERVAGGRYVVVDIDRDAAARYGLNIADVQDVVKTAIGGMDVTETVEGLERFPVNVRFPRGVRDSPERLRELPIVTPAGAQIPLQAVADIRVEDGPPLIKSENARLNGWIYVDIIGRDLGSYVAEAQRVVAEKITIPPGYSLGWSGQYEYMARAKAKLSVVIPVTLVLIMLLLYFNFNTIPEVLVIMATLPMALVGGILLMYWLDFNMSVAVGVGFIALAGVAVEISMVMLEFLNHSLRDQRAVLATAGREMTYADVRGVVVDSALQQIRPILMTVTAIIGGLLPIMLGSGTGSEVMRRIAAPMVGGMVTATLLTVILLPSVYLLWKGHGLKQDPSAGNRLTKSL